MKKKIIISSFILLFQTSFGQEYSSKRIKSVIAKLTELSVNLDDYDYNVPLDKPVGRKETFRVNDKYTSNFISSKKWFSDNEEHSFFIKIYRKGKTSDFKLMSESEFPNIRVYGFWALLKNNHINLAIDVLKKEKQKKREVEWKPFGCEFLLLSSDKLMSNLFSEENERRKFLRPKNNN